MSAVLFLFHKFFPGLCFFADEWPRLNCFLVFYHCATSVAGSLIEILDCQGLSIFHRRGWLLLLFAFALWCVAERRAQAAIFQGRLHFDSRNKSRLRIAGRHLSIFLSFLIRQSASLKKKPPSHEVIYVRKNICFSVMELFKTCVSPFPKT